VIGQTHGKEPQLREELRRVRQYELMTIFSPEVPEEALQIDIDRVGELVSQAGGTVTLLNRESPWGRRRLSYPIRHHSRDVRDGIYVLYYVDLDAQNVVEVERDLKLMDNLMRYLVTQQVAEPMIPESMKPTEEGETPSEVEGAAPAVEGTGEPETAAASSEAAADVVAEAAPETSETPAADATVAAGVAEAPAAEEPVVEVAEAPATEEPVADAAEAPAADEPVAEVAEAPAAEPDAAEVAEAPAADVAAEEAAAGEVEAPAADAAAGEALAEESPATDTSDESAEEAGDETGNQG
jgi:small subunit ribosomal protein S6